MQDAVLDEAGILVGGDTVDGLDGAALVDGDIHDGGAGAHGLYHLLGDQLGRLGAGDQNAADDQIGLLDGAGDVVRVGEQGLDAAAEDILQVGQALDADIKDGDVGAEADCHLGRVGTDIAAAENDDVAALYAGHAAQKDATAAAVGFQHGGADLYCHTAGHFAHRGQQGQAAVSGLNRLVSDADDLPAQERLGLLGVGGEVQVGKQDLAFAQQLILGGKRLFDLDDHIGDIVNLPGRFQQLCTDGGILFIGKAAAEAGAFLHKNRMTCTDKSVGAGGGQGNAALLSFDLFGTTNTHTFSPFLADKNELWILLYHKLSKYQVFL